EDAATRPDRPRTAPEREQPFDGRTRMRLNPGWSRRLLGGRGRLVGGALLLVAFGAGPAPVIAQEAAPEPPPPPVTLIFRTGPQGANVTFFRAPRSRQTVVSLGVAPNDSGDPQPAEIQQGHCADPGATTAYALSDVVNTQSMTTLDVGRRLLFTGTYSVV